MQTQNTEISRHPKSTKLSLYVQNPAQAKLSSASFLALHAKEKHNYNPQSFRYSFNKNKYVWEKLY